MKKNVNKMRKEVGFSFPGNAHLFWGLWETTAMPRGDTASPPFHLLNSTPAGPIIFKPKRRLFHHFFSLFCSNYVCDLFGWGDEKQTQCSG